MNLGTATIIRGDARSLPIADNSVDLIVTSPPYFALRSYTDAGEHYDGQIGSEPTPAEFLDALLEVTAECVRVLKPTGSIWVNLGDKYSDRAGPTWAGSSDRLTGRPPKPRRASSTSMAPRKSLLGLPWRYALRCIDDLGLILREEIVWSKPNGLPESVTDRARRSHEQWFHFTRRERYFAALDELREPHSKNSHARRRDGAPSPKQSAGIDTSVRRGYMAETYVNPLGRMPGSVWEVPSEPLAVPDYIAHATCCAGIPRPDCEDGVDHFAAFPTEWPKRLIRGWAPTGICVECGEGRRPNSDIEHEVLRKQNTTGRPKQQDISGDRNNGWNKPGYPKTRKLTSIVSYTCACPEPTAPTRRATVLDPFGGTGTTALVAKALGRDGIVVDRSADYCRLATWRTNDRDQLAKVLGVAKAEQQPAEQLDLFGEVPA